MVALAVSLGASRVEIAHVQYYGWALKNRASADAVAREAEARGGDDRGICATSTTAASSSMR